jgi:hypothetical protein
MFRLSIVLSILSVVVATYSSCYYSTSSGSSPYCPSSKFKYADPTGIPDRGIFWDGCEESCNPQQNGTPSDARVQVKVRGTGTDPSSGRSYCQMEGIWPFGQGNGCVYPRDGVSTQTSGNSQYRIFCLNPDSVPDVPEARKLRGSDEGLSFTEVAEGRRKLPLVGVSLVQPPVEDPGQGSYQVMCGPPTKCDTASDGRQYYVLATDQTGRGDYFVMALTSTNTPKFGANSVQSLPGGQTISPCLIAWAEKESGTTCAGGIFKASINCQAPPN